MLKIEKRQRIFIAFIFYVIAMGLAIAEFFIQGEILNFKTVIVMAFPYFIYYILISKTIDENTIWPIAALIMGVLFVYEGKAAENSNMLCEILEIILFGIQIVVAFISKEVRRKVMEDVDISC